MKGLILSNFENYVFITLSQDITRQKIKRIVDYLIRCCLSLENPSVLINCTQVEENLVRSADVLDILSAIGFDCRKVNVSKVEIHTIDMVNYLNIKKIATELMDRIPLDIKVELVSNCLFKWVNPDLHSKGDTFISGWNNRYRLS
ncbi:hypothetical protein [Desulfobacula sp.]|uniref:hypothetical protein n=1 Tax=Desulfobacula sp. TaxID=2593537 RepID=UPI001EBF75C7|nr:hypothetical protein [Desulfobacula sp.]